MDFSLADYSGGAQSNSEPTGVPSDVDPSLPGGNGYALAMMPLSSAPAKGHNELVDLSQA